MITCVFDAMRLATCNNYSDLQKHESSCLLSDRFWCIYPEPFELQKIFFLLLASLFEELSDEKGNFQIGAQNQLILRKTSIFPKKSLLLKKTAILKSSKILFHIFKVWEVYIPTDKIQCIKCSGNLFKSA